MKTGKNFSRAFLITAATGILCFCVSAISLETVSAANGSLLEEYELNLPCVSSQVETGSPVSGSASKLIYEDQQYWRIQSGNIGAGYQAVVTLSFKKEADLAAVNTLQILTNCRSSAEGTICTLYALNRSTGSFDAVQTFQQGQTSVSQDISVFSPSDYCDLSGAVTLRLVFENASEFYVDLDAVKPVIDAKADADLICVQNYQIGSAHIETGTVSDLASASNLKEQDGMVFTVVSSQNKVAWSSQITVGTDPSLIWSVKIDYRGKNSQTTNMLWISLYRYDTENWEVISMVEGVASFSQKSIVISDDLSGYLSETGDLKIRIYNSAGSSFSRQTDYLNVSVFSETADFSEKCCPTQITAEYGTVVSGDLSNIQSMDSSSYVMQSDSSNKIATQIKFQLSADVDKIQYSTFAVRFSGQEGINNQYISLYNYTTNNFVVFRTQRGDNNTVTIRGTQDSLYDIRRYISPAGEVTLRIYNSASSSFSRSIDYAELSVTYGDFESFTIAQVSDIHELIGSSNFQSIIQNINSKVKSAFTIISGDVTDHGTRAQYLQYENDILLFDNPVYSTPGNHDVRWWNANGKSDFESSVGPLYQSFDYGGIHFVLLDTSVQFELDGKINKAQLNWLKDDLASVPEAIPIIVFGHHPFKINNNLTARDELLQVLKPYNVLAYMCGHLHYYGNVVENGIPVNYITYVKDNAEQNYVSIEFTPNYYYIYKHKASDNSKVLWLSGKMMNDRKTEFDISGITVDSSGDVTVTADILSAPNGVSSVQARIDNYGSYTALSQGSDGFWTGTIDVSAYSPEIVGGQHFVGVEVFDELGGKWVSYQDYASPDDNADIQWVFETGDMIQSTATIHNGSVYVGSEDGNLYCIDFDTGSQSWSMNTGARVISKPAVYTDTSGDSTVIWGSENCKVYAADAVTGELLWTYTTGGGILSDPLVSDEMAFVGSGDGKIYCLDAQTGNIVWSYQTDGLMRQRPVISGGVLYAFVRDTYIWYAINIQDGSLKWRGNAGTDESLFVCGDVRPVIAGGKLWCIDAQNTRPGYLNMDTGSLEWTGSIPNVSSRGMATDGEYVFYCSNSGRLISAIDAETDEIVWQKDLRASDSDSDLQQMQIDSGLIYQDGVLYHVAERGRITGLDPETGSILFCFDAAGYPERVFWSTPEASGSSIICSGIDGNVYCVSVSG